MRPEDVRMTPDQESRFWSKVVADPGSGCWHWGGTVVDSGYGHFTIGRKSLRAHRLLYQHERGPIPAGLTLDHLCRNKLCVNPAHLEPVTARENILRGGGLGVQNRNKTHCKNGHEFSPENTRRFVRKGTERRCCRACQRNYSAAFLAHRNTEARNV